MTTATNPRLIYVGDVMCSWCWGFAPELQRVVDGSGLPLELMVGGLRPGPAAEPLTSRLVGFLDRHWTQIEQLTGQPFDRTVFGWEDWTYDSELPAMAVVTMRSLAPKETLRFFNRLQEAFYADARDVTDPLEYADLVNGFDVDRATFLDRFIGEKARAEAWWDFAAARSLGVNGFPTLLLHDDGYQVLAAGYRPAAAVEAALVSKLVPPPRAASSTIGESFRSNKRSDPVDAQHASGEVAGQHEGQRQGTPDISWSLRGHGTLPRGT